MPWVTIIVWLLSYLMSYSQTKDAGKSALIATGAAAAAYYTVEPTNPDAIWGDTSRDLLGYNESTQVKPVDPTTVPTTGQVTAPTSRPPSNMWDFGAKVVDKTGDVVTSWGPAGTVGVVAGVTAATSLSGKSWGWLILGGLAFVLLS